MVSFEFQNTPTITNPTVLATNRQLKHAITVTNEAQRKAKTNDQIIVKKIYWQQEQLHCLFALPVQVSLDTLGRLFSFTVDISSPAELSTAFAASLDLRLAFDI